MQYRLTDRMKDQTTNRSDHNLRLGGVKKSKFKQIEDNTQHTKRKNIQSTFKLEGQTSTHRPQTKQSFAGRETKPFSISITDFLAVRAPVPALRLPNLLEPDTTNQPLPVQTRCKNVFSL